jgi:hypothetical protein
VFNLKKGGVNLNTYIVRVYRNEEGNPHSLVGVVEEVGKKEKKAFTNLDDLWNILNSPREIIPRKRGIGKKGKESE